MGHEEVDYAAEVALACRVNLGEDGLLDDQVDKQLQREGVEFADVARGQRQHEAVERHVEIEARFRGDVTARYHPVHVEERVQHKHLRGAVSARIPA